MSKPAVTLKATLLGKFWVVTEDGVSTVKWENEPGGPVHEASMPASVLKGVIELKLDGVAQ